MRRSRWPQASGRARGLVHARPRRSGSCCRRIWRPRGTTFSPFAIRCDPRASVTFGWRRCRRREFEPSTSTTSTSGGVSVGWAWAARRFGLSGRGRDDAVPQSSSCASMRETSVRGSSTNGRVLSSPTCAWRFGWIRDDLCFVPCAQCADVAASVVLDPLSETKWSVRIDSAPRARAIMNPTLNSPAGRRLWSSTARKPGMRH